MSRPPMPRPPDSRGPGDYWLTTGIAEAKKAMEKSQARTQALRDAGWTEERPGEWRKRVGIADAHINENYKWPATQHRLESVTAEAERLTQQARHHSYGHPAQDFAKVTGMAQALWGRGPETPIEHALYMILVKVAREAFQHKRDNLVDISGYARTIEMIVEAGKAG